MNNARTKTRSTYSHSRVNANENGRRIGSHHQHQHPPGHNHHHNPLLSPPPTSFKDKIIKESKELIDEQCNSSKLQKLALPIFLSLFLFFCMHTMNTTTESYGPQTLSTIIQKQKQGSSSTSGINIFNYYYRNNNGVTNENTKLFYFQSQTRPRESIKLLSETFIDDYYATFINNEKYDKLVIVAIVSNIQSDVDKLCLALRSLVFLQGDVDGFPSPILIFQEGDLSSYQYEQIVLSTNGRPIAFPIVNLQSSFPKSFDLKSYLMSNNNNNSSSSNNAHITTITEEDLGYKQMLRFWISGIWKHSAIKPYDIIMRIDSDSCFKEVNSHLPNFVPNKQKRIQFHSQYVGREPHKEYVKELYAFTLNYITRENIIPRNTVLWHFITATYTQYNTLPVFMTHNSIIRKSLFTSNKDVLKFHHAITDSYPFGVYYYRWADSAIFLLSVAIFLSDEYIMTNRMNGYYHRDGCIKSDVDLSIEMFLEKNKWNRR